MERLAELYDKLQRRHRILLLLGGCAFALYISFVDNVEPAVSQYDAAVAERDMLATQLAGISQITQDKAAAELALQKAEVDLEALFAQLPKEAEIETLLGTMAEAARSSGVELESYVVGSASQQAPLSPNAFPTPMPSALPDADGSATDALVQQYVSQSEISVDVVGPYSGVTLFLDRVLSLPRIVRVGGLEMEAPPFDKITPGQPPLLKAKILVQTFSQRSSNVDVIAVTPSPLPGLAPPAPAPVPLQLSRGAGGDL